MPAAEPWTVACLVAPTVFGRGVIAVRDIAEGEVFESSPIISFGPNAGDALEALGLDMHVYAWGKGYGLAFGVGSFFNHSYSPNAMYIARRRRKEMDYHALRDIKAGEEIFINYNGDPDNTDPLWFDVFEVEYELEHEDVKKAQSS